MGAAIPRVITPSSASGAQVIDGSLRFDEANNEYLRRTPSITGDRRIFTWSGWVRRNKLGGTQYLYSAFNGSNAFIIGFETNYFYVYTDQGAIYSQSKLRDTSGWYHLMVAVDTTQADNATAPYGAGTDRVKMYINGVRETDFAASTWPTQNSSTVVNFGGITPVEQRMGLYANSAYGSDFQLSQVYLIDGQQLGPENFGYTDQLTNTWRPKKYTGDYNFTEKITLENTANNEAIDVVIDRVVDKCWIKSDGIWLGGGNPSDSSSAPTFNLLNGEAAANLYWFTTGYNTAHTITIGTSSETGNEPEWVATTGTGFSIDATDKIVTGTPSDTYVSARTGAMTDGNVYAFTFTIDAATSNFSGWFLSDSTSYSSGTPNEQSGGNTVGARWYGQSYTNGYIDTVGIYNDFQNINRCLDDGQLPILGGTGINSFYLPFDGNTSIGNDQSRLNPPNNGTTWSSTMISGGGTGGWFNNTYKPQYAFDGSPTLGNLFCQSNTSTIKWAQVGLSWSSSLKVMAGVADMVASLDGGTNVTLEEGAWKTVAWGPGSINTSLIFTNTSDVKAGIKGIMVDDYILVDGKYGNGWKALNFAGSNAIDKATGALPILNTVSGGKVATSGVRKEVGPNTLEIIKKSGCVSFDGVGDYITIGNNSDYDFGSGEFTMECWFYSKADASTHYTLVSKGTGTASTSSWHWTLSDKVFFYFYYGGSTQTVEQPATSPFTPFRWNHCVVVRDSNTLRMYINGTQVDTADLSGGGTPLVMNTTALDVRIGADSDGNQPLDAFLSNVRIVKGSCLYPNGTTFTSPTEPLTDVTNTKLLCCQSPTSATQVSVGSSHISWVPSGFTYWTAGMNANWNSSGSTTSGSNDYINIALPQSGKYYWETIINDPGTHRILGISSGAAGAGTLYTDNIFGYYYNNPIPLYLTRNASGTTRGSGDATNGGAGIATHGDNNPFEWVAGKKLMWALDADNDKIWFGYEGSWVESADPANGTNPTILGEDLSAHDYYFKLGYNTGGGNLTLTDVASGNDGINYPIASGDVYATDNELTGSCVLAIPFVGVASDVSNQINSGSIGKTISVSGDAIGITTESNFYGGSYLFDGTGDYVGIASDGRSDLDFGTGDYTIEFWVNPVAINPSYDFFFSKRDNYGTPTTPYTLQAGSNGEFEYGSASSQVQYDIVPQVGFGSYVANKWTHVAIVKDRGTITGYCNGMGKVLSSGITAAPEENDKPLHIGGMPVSGGYDLNGQMQDFRIYNGAAKYTSDFIPASSYPNILPDTPSGVALSSQLTKVPVTDGAVSFDGTGDYLQIADSADWDLGDTFTIEAWVNLEVLNSYNAVIAHGESSGTDWYMSVNSNGSCQFYDFSGTEQIDSSAGVVAVNTWNHIAISVNSGTAQWYVNGTASGSSGSLDVQGGGSNALTIGIQGTIYPFKGHISNLRVVKGTALYTAAFTPPTAPLTNVTNTKLLCCQSQTQAGAAVTSPNMGGINDGTVWSDLVSGTLDSTYGNANKAWIFRGATGTVYSDGLVSDPGKYLRMDFGTQFSSATSVKLYGWVSLNGDPSNGGTTGANENLKINGTVIGPGEWQGGGWDNHTFSVSGLTSLEWGYNCGSESVGSLYLGGIEVDGTLLVDPVAPIGDVVATTFNPFTDDINTVRGQETNYCTFNILSEESSGYDRTFHDGALYMDGRGDGTGTVAASSGKFYYEAYINREVYNSWGQVYVGVMNMDYYGLERAWGSSDIAAWRDMGDLYGDGKVSNVGIGVTYGEGDLISLACDVDNNKLYIAKNGHYINNGNPSKGVGFTHENINFSGGYTILVSDSQVGNEFSINCGQKPFRYVPPEGYQPLNYANLSSPAAVTPNQYVGVVTYTGNGLALANTAMDTSTAYRYHRILFEGDNAGGSVSELEFYDINGDKIDASDPNNAGGTVATNATQGLDGWTAFNGTRGGSNYSQGVRKDAGYGSVGFYISKDWGSGQSKIVYSIKVWGVDSYGLAGGTPNRYMKFEGSNDNATWTTLQTWNNARHGSWTNLSSTTVGEISDQVHSISGLNFNTSPDLVFIKNRDCSINGLANPNWHDTIRGVGSVLDSNNGNPQSIGSTYSDRFQSFDRNGFTVGTAYTGINSNDIAVSDGGDDFVAWCWRAGGSKNTYNVDNIGYATSESVNMNVGGLNSTLYDQTVQWSGVNDPADSNATITTKTGKTYVNNNPSWDATKLFNGLTTQDGIFAENAGDWIKWTPANGQGGSDGVAENYTFTDKVEVYVTYAGLIGDQAYFTYTDNDNSSTTTNITRIGWTTIKSGGGVLKELRAQGPINPSGTPSADHVYWTAIRIDGKLLVDKNVSMANVPSIGTNAASVGTKQGFSIVQYHGNNLTGQSVPHGLSKKPGFIIVKNKIQAYDWMVYHQSAGPTYYGILDNATAFLNDADIWADTEPTDSVFYVSVHNTPAGYSNGPDGEFIAYCWHDVPGVQKFGKYEGNALGAGAGDGQCVHLGFRPAIVWFKNMDDTSDWLIVDDKRSRYNPVVPTLYVNTADGDVNATNRCDFLSDGFKIRSAASIPNTGNTWLYAAWAHQPENNLYGAQSNAR